MNNLYSVGIGANKEQYNKNPKIKLPIKLTANVPVGNPNFTGTIPLIKYLKIAPKILQHLLIIVP